MLKKYILVIASIFLLAGCGSQEEASVDISSELANQVGDFMASIDESYGSTGSAFSVDDSLINSESLFLEKISPTPLSLQISRKLISQANAASCFGQGFSCSAGVNTRTFSGCTVGAATFNGSVAINWLTSASCAEVAGVNTVRRNPNFSVSKGTATVSVYKTGTNGQEISWTGTASPKTVTVTSDGIRRTATADGSTVYDVSTSTVGSISVSGTTRVGRRITGGTLRFTNHLNGEVCDVTPSNVVWGSSCTCATAGSWSGNCTMNGAFNVTVSSCGAGSVTYNGQSRSVTFDRCSGS